MESILTTMAIWKLPVQRQHAIGHQLLQSRHSKRTVALIIQLFSSEDIYNLVGHSSDNEAGFNRPLVWSSRPLHALTLSACCLPGVGFQNDPRVNLHRKRPWQAICRRAHSVAVWQGTQWRIVKGNEVSFSRSQRFLSLCSTSSSDSNVILSEILILISLLTHTTYPHSSQTNQRSTMLEQW